jgi:hypothetical protein
MMPLISRALPIPDAVLLTVVTGLLILVANMVYRLVRVRKKLDRRTSLLKQWVHIEQEQPRIKYRKIEIRLPKL